MSRKRLVTDAGLAISRARADLIRAMRDLDRAGEQATAHRRVAFAIDELDDAASAVVQGEARYAERAEKDDQRERAS